MSDEPSPEGPEPRPHEPLADRVEAALREVRDPQADVDVFETGVVQGVRVEGERVVIEAAVDAYDPETADGVLEAALGAARAVPGVEGAHVEPVAPDAADRITAAGVETVIAVASTKGGVGKSTVATYLASAFAADGRDVGFFDADIYGPNAADLLGADGAVRADEDDRPIPVRAAGMEVMSVALLSDGGPLAWRGAMAHDAVQDLYETTAWDHPDVLVLDLPPGTSDVMLTTLQSVPIDGAVVVTTPFHTSVADTGRSLRLFDENDVPVLGAVVNMGSFTCEACGEVHDLFPGGDPTEELGVPVLAELPFDPDLQADPSAGDVPAVFDDLAASVDERLEAIWSVDVPDDGVDLRDTPPDDRRGVVEDAYREVAPGGSFVLLSDRDPSPVFEFLADLEGVDPDAFETARVRKHNPETWVLETERPA